MRLLLLFSFLALFLLVVESRRRPVRPSRPQPKPKPKPSRPARPSRPSRPTKPRPKPSRPTRPKPRPKPKPTAKPTPPPIDYARWTAASTGGTCWWNLASNACAVCKPGGMQCGFPLQDKCYKKHPTQGCPGIPGHQVTLSTGGYPCYWQLDNSSCAWCNSAGYQTRNNICVTELNQEKLTQ